MREFNHDLIERARAMFYRVYADKETPTTYEGSTTEYSADRIRIYPSGWEYEHEIIARTDEELESIINEYMEEWPYQLLA